MTPRSVQWYRAAVEVLSASREPAGRPQRLPGARRRHRHEPAADRPGRRGRARRAKAPAPPSPPGRSSPAAPSSAPAGNSGTILAQLLRGLADQLAGQPPADGPAFAAAMQKAADTAYTAVADPEEGTFLTVARAGAEAAVAAVDAGRADLADVVRAAADGARVALEAHPGQLEVLREAGVVDAGGAGLCLVLDALVTTVTGVEPAPSAAGPP